jgi:hypothetical protein
MGTMRQRLLMLVADRYLSEDALSLIALARRH